jgi:flagellar basal-body rod protein FlgF
LHVDVNGLLQTATGHPVLNDNGPISIPPYSTIHVGRDGTISIVPVGQQASTMAAIARIKLVNPPTNTLQRGEDGLFHTANGKPAESDANVSLASGVLESSNVNVADAMVQMISLARRFDLQVKAMKNTDENAQITAKLLGLS